MATITSIESAIIRAHEDGRTPLLTEIGGEAFVTSNISLATSNAFGDIIDALANDWASLTRPEAAIQFIISGLSLNADRLVLAHPSETIAVRECFTNLQPFVLALEMRARDQNTHDVLRVEAVSGLMRFAIRERRWRSSVMAALHALESVTDSLAAPMLCRLAALSFEQFHDFDAIGLLERKADVPQMTGQAAYERGVIQISQALEQGTMSAISEDLRKASDWLRKAIAADEDRRDAKLYLLLTESLLPLTDERSAPSLEIVERLRQTAVVHHLWDAPAPGAEWLLPPIEAELDWIPLVDDIVRTSLRLREPSWLDAALVLDGVLRLYSSNRAIRSGSSGVEHVVRPAIEAAFVRERGLLAHLDQWIAHSGKARLNNVEIQRLRENIDSLANGRGPPGKRSGATSSGQKSSSPKQRPD